MTSNNTTGGLIPHTPGTKERLFYAALDLFSVKGYANVGIRDIAKAVNIKSASIYNHYRDKGAILDQIYKSFIDNYTSLSTKTDAVLEHVSTTPPLETIEQLLTPDSTEEKFEIMRKTLSIASMEYSNDVRAANIVSKVVHAITDRIRRLLNKLLELDLIYPIDVELFASVFVSTCLSSTMLLGQKDRLTYDQWKASLHLLIGLIRVKPLPATANK